MEKFEPNMTEKRKKYLEMLRRSNVSKILACLFVKHKSMLVTKNLEFNPEDLISALIEELQKARNSPKGKIINLSRASLFNSSKNIDLIVDCLLKFSGFKRFVLYNNISMAALRLGANFIEYRYYQPNSYLFHQEERVAPYFYGIIKGEVDVLKREFVKQRIPEEFEQFDRRLSSYKRV